MTTPPPLPPGLPRISRSVALPPVPLSLWLLVGAMGVAEGVLSLADRDIIGTPIWRYAALNYGAFWDVIFDGQVDPVWPYQGLAMFATHAFLHGDLMHYLLNNVILLAVGKLIAGIIGPFRMILLFLITAIGGALVYGLIAQTGHPMVGASGAVFGFIGFWKQVEFRVRLRRGMSLRPIGSMILALAIANVVVFFLLQGRMAWEAHLGGFVAGWLMGWFWRPVSRDGAATP
ncbi:MAG: rhomboid family intramembrane serine protease [Pseudomonadota bacterium]